MLANMVVKGLGWRDELGRLVGLFGRESSSFALFEPGCLVAVGDGGGGAALDARDISFFMSMCLPY